jgi:N-methylhydantoinase A
MFNVCIDIGGTFTDSVVLDEAGDLFESKVATTPQDLSLGLINSFERAAAHYKLTVPQFLGETWTIIHGTTVGLNTFLTRTGAKTALITTRGFRDIIEMRLGLKNITTSMYNMFIPPYEPLVPRQLRFTVEERTRYTGEISTPLNEKELRDVIKKLKREKVGAAAICFLHSYANPENERKAAEICRQELKGVYVCASCDVMPVVGEFARESTAILNAYVGPIVTRYFTTLGKKLKQLNFKGQLLIMQADALVQSVPEAMRKPVYLMNSGPASGPSGSVYIGKLIDRQNIVTIDMGGTSLDIGFVKDGLVNLSHSRWVDEEMVAIKMVDITTLGAGGGSLAWFDSMGLLRVGPKSAGADPGPACYGKGGKEAAVTDADLILGYIPADYFLGGRVPLTTNLARVSVGKVADRLHMSIEQAAHAMFSMVNSNMADAISVVTTKNGHDVRDFTLFAFGGAGPTHAAFLAEALGIPEVIVPPFASSFCAWSMFTLDIGRDYLRSYIVPVEAVTIDTINKLYQDMIKQALVEFKAFGAARSDIEIMKSMEFRYKSQFHDVEVGGIPDKKLTSADFKNVVEAFHKRYEELYIYSLRFYDVELRSLRILARVKKKAQITVKKLPTGTKDPSKARKRQRSCFFDGKFVKTPVYDSEKLKAGNVIAGPAIIEVPTTTVVIPKSWGCRVDNYGNYIIRRT